MKVKKSTPCNNRNKCKIDGALNSLCDIPDQKIVGLNLSFRDIAKRGNDLVCNYIFNNLNKADQEIVIANNTENAAVIFDIQTKVRRILSNWVNDPRNLTDSTGKYFGDKYGARITLCASDGTLIHDVKTFCKDVVNNRVGFTNNYILIITSSNNTTVQGTVNTPIFSTINLAVNPTVINPIYSYKKTYRISSSTLPTSDPPEKPLKYNVYQPELLPITVSNVTIADLYTTRKEIIQSSLGRYGYNARRSSTINTFNWYVSRKWGNDLFTNLGTMYYIRLSYFEFDLKLN
jgi:hypothetical protein